MDRQVTHPVGPERVASKLADINWLLPVLAASLALAGVAALYSMAGDRFDPWAGRTCGADLRRAHR